MCLYNLLSLFSVAYMDWFPELTAWTLDILCRRSCLEETRSPSFISHWQLMKIQAWKQLEESVTLHREWWHDTLPKNLKKHTTLQVTKWHKKLSACVCICVSVCVRHFEPGTYRETCKTEVYVGSCLLIFHASREAVVEFHVIQRPWKQNLTMWFCSILGGQESRQVALPKAGSWEIASYMKAHIPKVHILPKHHYEPRARCLNTRVHEGQFTLNAQL